jgi:RimJ/RimL family protein N-acetyltransferase
MPARYRIDWSEPDVPLSLLEPTTDEVKKASSVLALLYNDDHNRTMMANTVEMSAEDVVRYYTDAGACGDRLFFLQRCDELVGDADLRRFDHDSAEFAILVGPRHLQGVGLGKRFSIMAHALAFRALGLGRVYVTIRTANEASIRLFRSLGYAADQSQRARSLIDEPDDVSMSIDRHRFELCHEAALSRVRIQPRAPLSSAQELSGNASRAARN